VTTIKPGDRLRSARLRLGMEQRELAKRLNVPANTVSTWEHNTRSIPTNKLAEAARILHVSTDFLVGLRDTDVIVTPGQRLRSARLQAGLKQIDLARALHVQVNVVSMWETDEGQIPPTRLVEIAKLVHVEPSFLLPSLPAESLPAESFASSTTGHSIDWAAIGTIIAEKRAERGWSTKQIAEMLNVPPAVWSTWESGEAPIPLDMLMRVSKLLGLPLKSLLNHGAATHPPAERVAVREIPILGRVVAGIPIETQPDRRGETYVLSSMPGDFAVEVHGDSMVGAGIYEGDLAIIHQVDTWESVPPNSMVMALVNGEMTLKYLIREADPLDGDRWWLRAANPAFPDRRIDPVHDRVQGIVVSIQTARPPVAASNMVATSVSSTTDALDLTGLTSEQRQLILGMIQQFRRANRDDRADRPQSDALDDDDHD
jgi:repressor LexA